MAHNSQNHIIVIGAANVDITGISIDPLKFSESNPGKMTLGSGGVGRNIADNFARLSAQDDTVTYLLSAIGDDVHGKMVMAQSRAAGVNLDHCQIIKNHQTASYVCIIDYNGELRSAISDMSIVDKINVEYLASKAELISQAKLIVIDANLTQQAIEYICVNFNHIPIFVDTVSAAKAPKILPFIKHIHCITPNLNEAEILSDIHIKNDLGLAQVAEFFHESGVHNLHITLGSKGVYASSMAGGILAEDYLPAFEGNIINTNGAGDAFMAGLIYAFLQDMSVKQQANFAQSCAFLNTQSEHTINEDMSYKAVMNIMETQSWTTI